MKGTKKTGIILIGLALMTAYISGREFVKQRIPEPIIKGEGVTSIQKLSDYLPELKGTNGDTDIYVFKGRDDGGSTLILGGTHGNEPSGLLSAVLLIENAKVEKGTLYVIPRTNNSGFTHNDPQEGSPKKFIIKTPEGERWFRYGSRATNPLDQWPDPDVYIHASSGQQLSGNETRNLNRAYPGRKDGTFTEKIAFGIAKLISKNDIKMTIDLHEASPEYPVINATVAHDKGMEIASSAVMNLEMDGISMGLEPSPVSLRGLSHRELGDFTGTYSILMETANPAQGRLRGKTSEDLVVTGKDRTYIKAGELGRLFVPFDEKGHPLEERVGRHLAGINQLITAMGETNEEMVMVVENIPSLEELVEKGLGNFLKKEGR